MKSPIEFEHSGRLLNEQQVADQLGMSVAWVRKRRFQGLAPYPLRPLGTSIRYRPADILAFVESLTAPADKGGQ